MHSSASDSQGDSARTRILQAAKDLFAQHGYAGTSVQEVASVAGVSKANIFHHFASKAGLYTAVLDNATQLFQDDLAALSAADSSLEQCLAGYIQAQLAQMFADPDMVQLFMRQLLAEIQDPQRVGAERSILVVLENLQARLRPLLPRRGAGAQGKQQAQILALTLIGSCYAYWQARQSTAGQMQQGALTPEVFSKNLARLLTVGCASTNSPN